MPAIAANDDILLTKWSSTANYHAMPQAVVMALFASSLPLQGMWWLGNRSNIFTASISFLVSRVAWKDQRNGFCIGTHTPLIAKNWRLF